ncbi:MAG: RNA polymerase sigma factor [Wujia sp.]
MNAGAIPDHEEPSYIIRQENATLKEHLILQLYDTYAENVYRLALSYLGQTADAEDIVQNVFLKMLQIEPRIPQGCEKAYLLTIAANMCKNQLKSAHRRKAVSFDDSKVETGECAYTMDEGDIVACMQQLPEKYRIAIHLHYYEGYTFEEIAGMLHISKSAVSMRVHRGRDGLKKMLTEDFCWEELT